MELTIEQFLEQYGDVKVKFSSYYKFTFTFIGKIDDDHTVIVNVGGNSNDIYREHFIADKEYTVRELGINYVTVK